MEYDLLPGEGPVRCTRDPCARGGGWRLTALARARSVDGSNPEHAALMRLHLHGNGAAHTPSIEEDLAMIRAAGFEVKVRACVGVWALRTHASSRRGATSRSPRWPRASRRSTSTSWPSVTPVMATTS